MNELEDSTLELIYRRRVRTFYPAYVIMIIITGIVIALPVMKIDVVATTGGMIRPLKEPADIYASISGIVDSTILSNNKRVTAGDTLAWIRRTIPQTRIREYIRLIHRNEKSISDISAILNGDSPTHTTRYKQSSKSHVATLAHLQIRESFLQSEYSTARELFDQEVIPSHEYELAKSNYRVHCAKQNDIKENYNKQLEGELNRLILESGGYEGEINLIKSTLQDYFIVAPVTGTVYNCPGLTSGSVIRSGISLGIISPSGSLVAECFMAPDKITGISPGSRVRIRFNGQELRHHAHLETTVDHISNDVILISNEPYYQIRCSLDAPYVFRNGGTGVPVIKGMTFTANILRFRQSIASLILERVNRWANPALAMKNQ